MLTWDESSREVEVVDIVQALKAAARLLDGRCAWAGWTGGSERKGMSDGRKGSWVINLRKTCPP